MVGVQVVVVAVSYSTPQKVIQKENLQNRSSKINRSQSADILMLVVAPNNNRNMSNYLNHQIDKIQHVNQICHTLSNSPEQPHYPESMTGWKFKKTQMEVAPQRTQKL